MRADTPGRVQAGELVLLALGAWLIPGAGHWWLGRRSKAVVFFVALWAMFGIGLGLGGRLFPFELSQPLVFLAAVANLWAGLPYFLAWLLGWGHGQVVAATYEYANAFLIVAGLLNALVVLDAHDVAIGRK